MNLPPEEHYDLTLNENPYPVSGPIAEGLAEVVSTGNRYPDEFSANVAEALSAALQVPKDNVMVGAGASGVLLAALMAFCSVGDEVVYGWRSFHLYPVFVRMVRASAVEVSLDHEGRHDLDAMLAAVTGRTRVVILCNPNNPTGPGISVAALIRFLRLLPSRVIVILDEAYHEFVRDGTVADGILIYPRYRNLVVIRTFSKAYGLAGFRIGYGVSSTGLVREIESRSAPYAVPSLGQAAAVAALSEPEVVRERVEQLVHERARIREALVADGWPVPDAQGNFLWLSVGRRADSVGEALLRAGIRARVFPGEGVRIAVGQPNANEALLVALAAFQG